VVERFQEWGANGYIFKILFTSLAQEAHKHSLGKFMHA